MKYKHLVLLSCVSLLATPAHASLFSGDTLDSVADVLAWIVLFLAPIIGVGVFLMVHILPEKIAEKRHHPQLSAIKTLCLLSLVFGGMLWPFAWLWAYTRPVLHKLAYGVDTVDHGKEKEEAAVPIVEAEPQIVESKLQRTPASERDRHPAEV